MATIEIFGPSFSTFTRATRLAAVEKGVDHKLTPLQFGSDELLAVHPFGRIPAMRHGDVVLHETFAIARYIDEVFDGPALQPDDATERAKMTQWVCAISDYYDRSIIRRYVLPNLGFAQVSQEDQKTGFEDAKRYLKIADEHLTHQDFFVGDDATIADLFLTPIIFWFQRAPNGAEVLRVLPALNGWFRRMQERPSYQATIPDMPG
jgi:glutathione S-transferase